MLWHHLDASVRRWPDRVAIVAGDRELTFRELDEASNRLARGLVAAGVETGDRVAIYLDNRLETPVAIYGVLKAGAAVMMLSPATKADKLARLLDHARACAIVASAPSAGTLAECLGGRAHLRTVVTIGDGLPVVPGKTVTSWTAVQAGQPQGPVEPRGIDLDLAFLTYTSGSTGVPKGVMLTHVNVKSATQSVVEYLKLTSDDVILSVLPLSFGYGLLQLLPAMAVGARIVLEKGIVFPHVTLTQMAKHRATGFAMVPTIATMLLNLDLSQYDLSSLRFLTNAGAGMPTELVRRVRTALPHAQLFLMYGQTECLRVSYLEPGQVDRRPDSVGLGMPNQQLFIVDEDRRPVGPGVTGELVVRGAHVMAGYWELPEETDRKLLPGLFPTERQLYTGDLFRRDEDGYLYFVSRKDDIIKSRGEKVSPREVENVLYTLPGVMEAAVVGVPDPLLGSAVKAFVVLQPGVTLDARAVQRHCAGYLEEYMVPSAVEFMDELPKNERGKISKRHLTGEALE